MRLAAATSQVALAQVRIHSKRLPEALSLLEPAEKYLEQSKQSKILFGARMMRVDAMIEAGENEDAHSAAIKLLAETRQGGQKSEVVLMLGRVAHTALAVGDYPRAFALHAEMRAEYRRIGRTSALLVSLINEAQLHAFSGDTKLAREMEREAEALLPTLGADGKVLRQRLAGLRALIAIVEGNSAVALAVISQAPSAEQDLLRATALLVGGNSAAGLIVAREANVVRERNWNPTERARRQCILATALMANGRQYEAEAVAGEALTSGGMRPQRLYRLQCLLVLAAARRESKHPRWRDDEAKAMDEFALFTKSWTPEARAQLRQRADWKPYFLKETQ